MRPLVWISLGALAPVLSCGQNPLEAEDAAFGSGGAHPSQAPPAAAGSRTSNDSGGGPNGGGGEVQPGSGGSTEGEETPDGFYQMENLDRGLVVVPSPAGGNLVSFRWLGYEPDDAAFSVLRDGELLVADLTEATSFHDPGGQAESSYEVERSNLASAKRSTPIKPWGTNYLSIATPPPNGGTTPSGEAFTYTSGDGSAGDLDGDGRLDLVLKWDPSNLKDNSQAGYTGNTLLDGYTLEGERLFRIDLGRNIRAGAHYSPFLVYDLDGDGRSELAVKTAPGARDGTGNYLSLGPAATDDDAADFRNGNGYVLTGPEYLSVFDGATGKELATVLFEAPRGTVSAWGDGYGNRVDRFVASVAFVEDSGRPSLIFGRGMYTRTTFSAWSFLNGKLTRLWLADHEALPGAYGSRGAHSMAVANVDDDPMQELINGGATFDHDGSGLCGVPFYGHGDAVHVTDLIPSRPGLELFQPYEGANVPAYSLRDARTCELLWQGPNTPSGGEGPGRGVAGDVDPTHPGAEAWVSGGTLLRAEDGSSYADKPRFDNFLVWWDGDLSRELLNSNTIRQYDAEGSILTAEGCAANNGTKSTPTLSADLLGDFREEVVFRCGDSVRVYVTEDTTEHRIRTLMHDPQYRMAISWQNGGYNQPPHPSFHIGEGMVTPAPPDIHVR